MFRVGNLIVTDCVIEFGIWYKEGGSFSILDLDFYNTIGILGLYYVISL